MATIASRCFTVIIAVGAIGPAIRAEEPKSGESAQEIKRLIDQLGSECFKDREQATHRLSKLGKSALPGLRVATKSPDAEVRRRAQRLVRQIEAPAVRPMNPPLERLKPAAKSYL